MIATEDLRFRHRPQDEELFGGLSHSFAAGVVTAVTGPSGRGKSTLLYLIGLLLRPTSGEVRVDDVPAARLSDRARAGIRARSVGFVFQDSALDPSRTILDAVIEPALYAGRRRSEMAARAREMLEAFGVAHRHDHRPGEISGGQAQRVAVCRALINEPATVLADEPTGNLDRSNAEGVLDALQTAARAGRTVIIASHDPFVLERADAVLEL